MRTCLLTAVMNVPRAWSSLIFAVSTTQQSELGRQQPPVLQSSDTHSSELRAACCRLPGKLQHREMLGRLQPHMGAC
jgi:hypothetical protein